MIFKIDLVYCEYCTLLRLRGCSRVLFSIIIVKGKDLIKYQLFYDLKQQLQYKRTTIQ